MLGGRGGNEVRDAGGGVDARWLARWLCSARLGRAVSAGVGRRAQDCVET